MAPSTLLQEPNPKAVASPSILKRRLFPDADHDPAADVQGRGLRETAEEEAPTHDEVVEPDESIPAAQRDPPLSGDEALESPGGDKGAFKAMVA